MTENFPPPREQRRHPNSLTWSDRFRGAMLGGAVGDALGAGVRDRTTQGLRHWFGAAGVTDYLPAFGRRGSATELTQLTVFTLEALLRAKAAQNDPANPGLPTEFVRVNHLRWLHTQGVPWDYAMGGQLQAHPEPNGWLLERPELFSTRNPAGTALRGVGRLAVQPQALAAHAAEPPLRDDAVAECVVWAAPTMVWGGADGLVFAAGADVSYRLTSHNDTHAASGLHADVLAQLIRGVPLWDGVRASESHLARLYRGAETPVAVHRTIRAAMFAAQEGRRPDPDTMDIEFDTGGRLGELGIALASVASTDSLVDAVLMAVNQSADSSVTGALTGQLAGAVHGPDAIPGHWRGELELAEIIETLCEDAAEAFAPPPPPPPLPRWAQRYVTDTRSAFSGPLELEPSAPREADTVDTEPFPVSSPRVAAATPGGAESLAPREDFASEPDVGPPTQVLPVIDAVGEEAVSPLQVAPRSAAVEPAPAAPEPVAPEVSAGFEYRVVSHEDPVDRDGAGSEAGEREPLAVDPGPVDPGPVETGLADPEPDETGLADPEPVPESPVLDAREPFEGDPAPGLEDLPERSRDVGTPDPFGDPVEPEAPPVRARIDLPVPEPDSADVDPDPSPVTRPRRGPARLWPDTEDESGAREDTSGGFEGLPSEGTSGPDAPGPEEAPVPDAIVPGESRPQQPNRATESTTAWPESVSRVDLSTSTPFTGADPIDTRTVADTAASDPVEPIGEAESAPFPETEPPDQNRDADQAEPDTAVTPEPDSREPVQDATAQSMPPEGVGDGAHAAASTASPGSASQRAGGGHAAVEESDTVAPSLTERVLGSLLGGALGDAFGSDLEFATTEQIIERFGAEGPTGLREAYGVHGAITDDTQMTLFTAEGLIRASVARRTLGRDDPIPEVQLAYQRWLHTQGVEWESAAGPLRSPQPDGWLICVPGLFSARAPGKTVFRALEGIGRGLRPGSLGEPVNDSKGCGGVMRAAPAALWSSDPAEVFELGARTAALTHGHPSGYLPAGALAVIVQQAVLGRGLDDGVWLALQVLETWEGHEETSNALAMAVDLAAYGVPTPHQIAETLGGGWTGEQALAIAVCATLAAGEDVELAVRTAVVHSGDSDSTGAICGNIVGALVGIAGLPVAWLADLELRDVVEQVAMDCVAEFDRGPEQQAGPTPGPENGPPVEEDWRDRYPVRTEARRSSAATQDPPTQLLPALGSLVKPGTSAAEAEQESGTGPAPADGADSPDGFDSDQGTGAGAGSATSAETPPTDSIDGEPVDDTMPPEMFDPDSRQPKPAPRRINPARDRSSGSTPSRRASVEAAGTGGGTGADQAWPECGEADAAPEPAPTDSGPVRGESSDDGEGRVVLGGFHDPR